MDGDLGKRITKVAESILGNEAITENLDDEAANLFINWAVAKGEVIARSTEGMDEKTAEETMYPRLKAIRRIPRDMGGWMDNPQEVLEKVINQVQIVLGDEFTPPEEKEKAEFLNSHQNDDINTVLIGLKEFLLERSPDDISPEDKKKWYSFLSRLLPRG
jgi:hypothetical protein